MNETLGCTLDRINTNSSYTQNEDDSLHETYTDDPEKPDITISVDNE